MFACRLTILKAIHLTRQASPNRHELFAI